MLRAGSVPPDLADAQRLVLLAESGVLAVSLGEYDDLPAPMIDQIETFVGARLKRRADKAARQKAIDNARKALR